MALVAYVFHFFPLTYFLLFKLQTNMGRKKRITRKKNVQHVLPQINLSLDSVDETISVPTPPRIIIEDHPVDEVDNFTLIEAPSEEERDSGNESDTIFTQNQKRRINNTEIDDENTRKKTRKLIISFFFIIGSKKEY